MKRRGTGRRQVLNLNDKQDSPRRTWQTKYQQICSDSPQNGTFSEVISSTSSKSPVKNNPLSGLLGHYHSDSDTEDETKKEADLSTQVSDFMKEIQTIAPSEKPAVSHAVPAPSTTLSNMEKKNVQEAGSQPFPTMAWQECYDENSGYSYFWNMETNEVTWEMPPEYQAYMESGGQEGLWTSEQQMNIAYNPHLMAHHPHQAIAHLPHPHHLHNLQVPPVPPVVNAPFEKHHMNAPGPANAQGSSRKAASSKKKRKNKDVDSDDEKIEMITSYGPASDEDSDDDDETEAVPPDKRRRVTAGKPVISGRVAVSSSATVSSIIAGPSVEIGPKPCPLIGPMLDTADEAVAVSEHGGRVHSGVAAGDEDSQDSLVNGGAEPGKSKVHLLRQMDGSESALKRDQYTLPDSSEEKPIPEVVAQHNRITSLKLEDQDGLEDPVGSGTSTPIVTSAAESDADSVDTEERLILLRLKKQAQLLRELGGELPDEVQQLIEPSTSSASPLQADAVIAQIEKELPPDYRKNSKRLSEPKKQIKRNGSDASGSKSSPKISSFALIAGYGDDDGDDSDTEEEKKRGPPEINDIKEAKDVGKSSLFPIMDNSGKFNPGSSTVEEEERTKELINSLNNTMASTSKASKASDSSEVASASSGLGPLETNMPDSTTCNKSFKRKKRLDVELLPKPVVVAQAADSGSEKPGPSAAVSTIVSSSATFSSWTSFNSDPASTERRGFGFQANEDDSVFNSAPKEEVGQNVDKAKRNIPQKKGLISFVKAETLNPDAQPETEAPPVEEKKEKPATPEESRVNGKDDKEADRALEEMAQLLREKVTFLGEGKDPVPPVQAMAIQIETLLSAWQTGALARSYWSRWLADTSTELARLEQAAAPSGWACQWDRYGILFRCAFTPCPVPQAKNFHIKVNCLTLYYEKSS